MVAPNVSCELDFILVALGAAPPRWWQILLRWCKRHLERRVPPFHPGRAAR